MPGEHWASPQHVSPVPPLSPPDLGRNNRSQREKGRTTLLLCRVPSRGAEIVPHEGCGSLCSCGRVGEQGWVAGGVAQGFGVLKHLAMAWVEVHPGERTWLPHTCHFMSFGREVLPGTGSMGGGCLQGVKMTRNGAGQVGGILGMGTLGDRDPLGQGSSMRGLLTDHRDGDPWGQGSSEWGSFEAGILGNRNR